MQGATHMGDLTEHPKIHFPYDCMAAYTLRLPESHLLKKLLLPHQRFTLALNDTVLNNYFLSIVINPWMTQSPFDVGPPEVRKYLQECKTSFTFDTEPFPDTSVKNTPFNVFLMRYFSLTHQFVSEVVNTRPDEFRDENVQQWADDIASIVPGFPAGKDIIKGDTVIDVVAKIIWNISINHCVDHYSYYCIPWAKNPWRVRVPPPKSPQDKVDFNKVMNRVDMWKLAQCQDVFFYTGASHTMAKIDYKFKDTTLKSLNEWYIAEMKKVDSIKDKARIMELQAIGQSIDF
ncbi:hypothetical protein BKA69DRAFT_723481 [Paraphysoderma sedebokerense]|nr:hypothetical protein BKA69DRAFT_723481 [Paraphysoderma sedebokerense]